MTHFLQIGNPIEPASVKFTFSAPGWYVSEGLLITILLITAYLLWQHYQRNRYRRQALQWLRKQESSLLPANESGKLLYETDTLMKRIALQHYQRDTVAGLQGSEWIAFLNQTCKTALFDETDVQCLKRLYAKDTIDKHEIDLFINKTKKWIKTHNPKRVQNTVRVTQKAHHNNND